MVSLRAAVSQADGDKKFRELPGWTIKISKNGHAWHFLLYSFQGSMLHFPSSKHLCHTHLTQDVCTRLTPATMPANSRFPGRTVPILSADSQDEQSQYRRCQWQNTSTCTLSMSLPPAVNYWDPMDFPEGLTHTAEGFHNQEEQTSTTKHKSGLG